MSEPKVRLPSPLEASADMNQCPLTNQIFKVSGLPTISCVKSMMLHSTTPNCPWPDQALNRFLTVFDALDHNQISEIECLEILIYLSARRDDSRALAESAIRRFGSLANVFSRPNQELRNFFGMDFAISATVTITKIIMKMILAKNTFDRKEIESHSTLIDYLSIDLRHAQQETLRILYIDKKNKLIKDEIISEGTIDKVAIFPREIGKKASYYCSSSVILAHNHLSDDPTPSQEDIHATLQTKRVLNDLDIVLRDHIIIARRGEFSMRQEELI